MAINAATSSANPSSALPTTMSFNYYYYPTKSSCLQVFNTFHLPSVPSSSNSNSNSKHGSKPAPAPAVALSSSAATHEAAVAIWDMTPLSSAEAARAAVASAFKDDDDEEEEEKSWRNGVLVRRKRRRKRRKPSLGIGLEKEKTVGNIFLKPEISGKYLTPTQEAEYSFCLKEESRIEAVRKRIEGSNKEEVTLSQWAKAAGMSRHTLDKILCNGKESQDRITRCYRRLVISVASSYQGRGLSLQDLIQEGNLGLIHGAKKFNPERGYKLSTYVYWWIRQAMSRAVAKKSRLTRLPGSISELVPKICEANAVLSMRLRKLPTCEEITKLVKKDRLTIALALHRSREPISLDQARSDGGSMSLQDIVPGPDEITPEAMVRKQAMKRDLDNLLKGLSEREKHILALYYGLNGHTPLSFEDIGRRLKLSRERVRQISCAALGKLRNTSVLNDLKVYIA